jgi:hypothetical protein
MKQVKQIILLVLGIVIMGMGTAAFADTTASAPAEAPTEVTATAGNQSVTLAWQAVPAADSYKVYRSTTSAGTTVVIANATALTYTDQAVISGETYYYQISAINDYGESDKSIIVSATPPITVTTGRALLNIIMTNGSNKEYDLSIAEVDTFLQWYENTMASGGIGYYKFEKTYNLGPFTRRDEYLTCQQMMYFEVNQYQ